MRKGVRAEEAGPLSLSFHDPGQSEDPAFDIGTVLACPGCTEERVWSNRSPLKDQVASDDS